ncbi:hypothetical protein FRC00_014525 [Tulasnella sp. 408]|nr:hypothetical protein FRC00_014525 [Tulasnella sp. 408]
MTSRLITSSANFDLDQLHTPCFKGIGITAVYNADFSESQSTLESEDIGKTMQSAQPPPGEATPTAQTSSENNGTQQHSSPLNLPSEMFWLIVKYILSESGQNDNATYYGQLTRLCLVCKDWAVSIRSHRLLWTYVDLSVSRELLQAVLSRSGGSPLDIVGPVESLSVAGMIQAEAHRWRSLTILSNDGNIMNFLLAQPAPRLQKLTLLGPDEWVAPANVFGSTAPMLEEVVVQTCALSWRSPILSDLTKLTLHRVGHSWPNLDELLDILAASPRLRDLKVAFTTVHVPPANPRRVNLPELRSLQLDYLSRELMTWILGSIDAPLSVDCDFLIRVEEYMPLEGQLTAVSNRLAEHARNVNNTPSTLTLQMGFWKEEEDDWDAKLKYEVEGEGLGPLNIVVMTHPGVHVDVLNHLTRRIQPYVMSLPPKLRLVKIHRVHPYDDNAHLLCRLSRTFPNAQEIALVDLDFGAMVDALYRLFPEPASGTSPLFPHLIKLTWKQDAYGDSVFWLRDYRSRTMRGGFDPLPHNLELRLEGGWIGAGALQALQQVVPGTLTLDNVQVKEEIKPSASDGVEFEDLERAVRSVQRFLGEAIRTIAAKSRSRRSSPSILPVELFLCVVKDVLADTNRHRNKGYYGQLTKLCLVCKPWADTIHSLPELWTQVNISGHDDPSVYRKLLAVILPRSGDLPLDLVYHRESFAGTRAMGMVTSETHRWRSLTIRSDYGHAVERLLVKRAQALKKLDLNGPNGWMPPTNMFEDTAPQLEAVKVQGCGLPWSSPILVDLKELTLWRIEEHAPQINILLDILISSPRLSKLVVGFTHIQLDTYNPSRRVALPYLRSLRVADLPAKAMTAVLKSIDAPLSATCTFSMEMEGGKEMAVELADVSERLVALARSVSDGSCTLNLRMGYEVYTPKDDEWDAILKYETEGERLGPLSITVSAPPDKHAAVLSHLVGRIQPYTKASPHRLRLEDIHRTVPEDEDANLLLTLHRTFPNVQDIALVDLRLEALVDAFHRLFPQPGSETSPLFPHLTTLTVKKDSHDNWARWLHGYRSEVGKEGGVDPLPSNLIIGLEGGLISAKYLQALQKLAPDTLSLDHVRVEDKVQR